MAARNRSERTPPPLLTPAAGVVFTTLLTRGPMSRVDITRVTGLSAGAVTKAISPLINSGYVAELGATQAPGAFGRPPSGLQVQADRAFFLGLKVTSDELIAVITDLRAQIRATRHVPLLSRDIGHVLGAITGTVTDLLAEDSQFASGVHHLGLTVAGDVDRSTGVVHYSPFLGWHDVPLAHLVQTATGQITVIENDVRALTLAEEWFGAGVGAATFALVTVGAGIGCGLVVNGAVVAGAHGVSGEIGHLTIERDGPPCHCGNNGCVEAIASDAAILDQVHTSTGDTDLSLTAAVALARGGNPAVRAVFSRAGHAIGLALASVANLIGPERIVLSGEGLSAYDLFEEQIRSTLADHAFGAAADCKLIVRPLPFDAWARGAAAVAIRTLITPGKEQ